MVRKILLICGIVSSVWYVFTDVIGTLRYPGYSYTDQWFSELTAQGAPTRPLMIALNEIPYNLLVLAFAAGVWESAGLRRAGRITAAGLAGFAVLGFVTGVIFPMPTREAAGKGTLRNTMHIPGTAVMSPPWCWPWSLGPRYSGIGSGITRMGQSSQSSCLVF